MKKGLFFLLYIGLIIISVSCSVGTLKLVDKGKSPYKIVISDHADSIEIKAAQKLQYYLYRVSEAKIPIVTDSVDFNPEEIIIGNNRHLQKLSMQPDFSSFKEDGFEVYTEGKTLALVGGKHKGPLYAVYYFLEEYLGCRMFAIDAQNVPRKRKIRIPQIDDSQQPEFAYREISTLYPKTNQEYANWHKLDNGSENEHVWGLWGYSFGRLVPPQKYFVSHPEYFALINGKRVSGGQLCFANQSVVNLIIENIRQAIKENPMARYWSVAPNDNNTYCTCARCVALYKKYGGYSGALVHFVNQIANKFPDKVITTIMNQSARPAPQNIRPNNNVLVILTTGVIDRSKSIVDDPAYAPFRKDFEDWQKLTGNIMIWNSPLPYSSLMTPFPNLYFIKPEMQYFARNHCRMIYDEGAGLTASEFDELRTYLTAKLMWDPDADFNSILDDFLNGYYGPAGTYIRQYIDVMYYEFEKSNGHLKPNGFPYDSSNTYLTPEMFKKYQDLFDKAEMSVYDDPIVLLRVRKARLPLDYAMLEISLRDRIPGFSFLRNEYGRRVARPEMMDKLNRFVRDCDMLGVKQLDMAGSTPRSFRSNVLRYVDKANEENLAKGKTVRLFTRWNRKFSDEGPKSLVDGRYGVADAHYNWLGFEHEDMEAIIDLEQNVPVRKVSADFLQQPDECVFLPSKVIFYLSTNGHKYIKIASLQNHYSPAQGRVIIQQYSRTFRRMKARYVKIVAKSIKNCPSWHPEAGKPAWMLVDEVVVQ